ncbi:MAG: DUF4395 domain-containing protein [Micropruina sp.]
MDARGPRFGAAVTSVVLAVAVMAGPSAGFALLLLQALAFAAGAIDPRYHPYGWIFRRLVAPKLAPATEWEDARPPRFAQGVGLAFAVLALLGAGLGAPTLFYVAAGMALVAALLNAVFNFCLGCELFLLGLRVASRGGSSARTS